MNNALTIVERAALERISEWDGFARMPDDIREKVDAAVSQATGVSL